MKLKQLRYIGSTFVALLALLFTPSVLAAPGALATEPLNTSARADPNIMLLFDSSGSMNTPVPGTPFTRLQIAKDAAIGLVNEFEDVRVGLARFTFQSGARILVGIDDIDSNRTALINGINSITASGWTPLAESLHEIGRYFVQGHNATLTMHPGEDNETTKSAYTIFNRSPTYNSGVQQASPIQYFCQKNFIVILTDGEPTRDRDISNSTGLQDYDGDCVDASPPCLTFDRKQAEQDAGLYNNDGSDFLDDVAGALFEMDLRPDLTDQSGNPAKNNVLTYPIGFADPAILSSKLMTDTAANGGGKFLTATNAAELVDAFEEAAAAILSQVSSSAPTAFNTQNLSVSSALFLAQYNTTRWFGNIIKFPVDAQGNIGAQAWDAAAVLASTLPGNRVIITFNRDTGVAVAFRVLTALSAAQQADLNMGPSVADGLGQARIDYFRGDRSLEGTTFRERGNLLGDFVHSGPVFVGPPESAWPDIAPFPTASGQRYSDFAASNQNRTPIVYAADNAGMLHGFNANTGVEEIAYIASNLFSASQQAGLHYLTDPNYTHRYYSDLTAVIQDAYVAGKSGGVTWRTILVAGQRGGGRGYSALDITNPGSFSELNANKILLWEFNSADNPNLGFTFSEPVIALMNNGRWAAIFGNGYNNTGTGSAQLFIVYLDGGLDGVWTLGSDYLVIDTKVGTLSNLNGLGSVAGVDLDGNRTIDRIYGGDVRGRMWAFDVSGSTQANWKVAYGSSGSPDPLFRNGNNRPITAKPIVVKHPTIPNDPTNAPNVLVLFGSGQYLTNIDKTTTFTQSFYGVWDSGTGDLRRSDLVTQNILGSSTATQRIVSDKTVDYAGGDFGWKINLTSGERVIVSAKVRENIVFFNTLIPDNSTPCSFGGTGWIMGVKVINGGQPQEVIIDVNNDDQLDDTDKLQGQVVSGIKLLTGIPTESALRGDFMFVPTSDGNINRVMILNNNNLVGRISWEELTGKND